MKDIADLSHHSHARFVESKGNPKPAILICKRTAKAWGLKPLTRPYSQLANHATMNLTKEKATQKKKDAI